MRTGIKSRCGASWRLTAFAADGEIDLTDTHDAVVGLIPAAGIAARLGRLPFSKELLPLRLAGETPSGRGFLVSIENTIASLVENDITRQHVIIAPGKWDIPAYLGDGAHLKASVSYLVAEASPSVPHSLDVAYRFVESCEVVLVFPDILFRPRDAISEVVAHRVSSGADVALALVPSSRGDKVDIVLCDDKDAVVEIRAKPGAGNDGWTWVAAAWSGRFTEFLHRYLQHLGSSHQQGANRELYAADVLNAAIRDGLAVRSLKFPDGDAIDIGTADDLSRVWLREP